MINFLGSLILLSWFIPYQSLPGNFGIGGVLLDFENDGDLDLVVGNYTDTRFYVNDGNGYFTYRNNISQIGWWLASGDINKDGFDDLVAGYGDSAVTILLNDKNGNFQISQSVGSTTPGRLYLADLNSDGYLDLVVGSYCVGQPQIYFGSDNGFIFGQSFPDDNCIGAVIADFDNDGDLDIAFARWPGRPDRVYFNDGSGYFIDSGQNLLNLSTFDIAGGDIDNDGDIDLLTGQDDCGSEPNKIWLNNGEGQFTLSSIELGNYYTHVIKMVDIDKDGDLDVFEGNTGTILSESREKMYLNNGSGTAFTEITITERKTRTNELLLGDINGDGLSDLIDICWWNQSGNEEPESVYVYINDGNNTVLEGIQIKQCLNFQFYPNPFRQKLNILMAGAWQNCKISISIYDASGQLIKEIQSRSSKIEWQPDPGLPAGTYFVRVKTDRFEKIQKIIYLK